MRETSRPIRRARRCYPEKDYPHQALTEAIIEAAIAVHKELGPGFVESIYENALVLELLSRGHEVARQKCRKVCYRGQPVGEHRADLLVDDEVVVELKSVEASAEVHKAQLRSTLKAFAKKVGLLINFNQPTLSRGVRRVICWKSLSL